MASSTRCPSCARFFSLETGQGGDASTVNVGAYRRDGSYLMTDGPSYRQIIDLSGGGDLLMNTTGQSGNVLTRDIGISYGCGGRAALLLWERLPRKFPLVAR